jgi:hypothetical protein
VWVNGRKEDELPPEADAATSNLHRVGGDCGPSAVIKAIHEKTEQRRRQSVKLRRQWKFGGGRKRTRKKRRKKKKTKRKRKYRKKTKGRKRRRKKRTRRK